MGFAGVFNGMVALWGRWLAPWFWPALATAVPTLAVAFLLAAWVGRREFNRRRDGVQQFRSYGHAVGTSLIEGIVSLVSRVFLFVGLVALMVVIAAAICGQYH